MFSTFISTIQVKSEKVYNRLPKPIQYQIELFWQAMNNLMSWSIFAFPIVCSYIVVHNQDLMKLSPGDTALAETIIINAPTAAIIILLLKMYSIDRENKKIQNYAKHLNRKSNV